MVVLPTGWSTTTTTDRGRTAPEEGRASARPLAHVGARTKGRQTEGRKDTAKARSPANKARVLPEVRLGSTRLRAAPQHTASRNQEQLGV